MQDALKLNLDSGQTVSALLDATAGATACFVFAHGAGAGMTHTFMEDFSRGLARRKVATLCYQFPYMEGGGKRVDSPAIAQATVRAAVVQAARLFPGLPLFAGGKSFGGRMTSQAEAEAPLPEVRGIVFVGFPLHVAGKPAIERAAHLSRVTCPMLFLQGTRDALADPVLLKQVTSQLGERATVRFFDDADHSFHVRKRSGTTDVQVLAEMLDATREWMARAASC